MIRNVIERVFLATLYVVGLSAFTVILIGAASRLPSPASVSFHAKPLACEPGQLHVYVLGPHHEAQGHCEDP